LSTGEIPQLVRLRVREMSALVSGWMLERDRL